MKTQFRKTKDTLTPHLKAVNKKVRSRSPMATTGKAAVRRGKDAFRQPSLRPRPWSRLKEGGEATLRRSGKMRNSIRVRRIGPRSVEFTASAPYAKYQQVGTRWIPSRPFLPFNKHGRPDRRAVKDFKRVLVREGFKF